jgi:hypothetical protein
MFDNEILDLIEDTRVLNTEDKGFLIQVLPRLSSLEKFKLRTSLNSEQSKAILSTVQLLKLRYPPQPKPEQGGILGSINKFINPPKPQKLVSVSILSQPSIIGSAMPTPIRSATIPELSTIDKFSDLLQLNIISQKNLTSGTTDQDEIFLNKLLNKLDELFGKIKDLNSKRGYFASYLQSPLFVSYINSGMTAMRHPELEPREVVLNTLHSVNENYLNNKTFEMASIITNHIRHLCGV